MGVSAFEESRLSAPCQLRRFTDRSADGLHSIASRRFYRGPGATGPSLQRHRGNRRNGTMADSGVAHYFKASDLST